MHYVERSIGEEGRRGRGKSTTKTTSLATRGGGEVSSNSNI